MNVNRRNFLSAGASAAAAAPFAGALAGEVAPASAEFVAVPSDGVPFERSALVGSAPLLQAPGDTTMGITWEIRKAGDRPQTVFASVEYADNPDFVNAKTVHMTRNGRRIATSASAQRARVAKVRLTDLKPNTPYWYRTVTQKAADGKPVGAAEKSPIYKFFTYGPNAAEGQEVAFAVVNDPHSHFRTWERIVAKINELKPSAVVYCGDLAGETEYADQMVRDVFLPVRKGYGASVPILYAPGNHDSRGAWSRNRHEVLMPRPAGERGTRYEILLHNFAVRIGGLALIGLDTGEDKADCIWEGDSDFDAQNRLQTEWLKEVLERPDITSAKQIVVFTHIPLWDSVSDTVVPGREPHYYDFCQYRCKRYWAPLLNRANVRLVVSAHTHYREYGDEFRAHGDRTWHQLIGGGPWIGGQQDATVIYGKMSPDGRLKVDVYSIGQAKWMTSDGYLTREETQVAFDYEPRTASDRA